MEGQIVAIACIVCGLVGLLIGHRIGTGRLKVNLKKKLEKLEGMVGNDVDKLKKWLRDQLD